MKVEFVLVTRRLRPPTLAGQLLLAQLAILLTVLVLVGLVSLAQSEATFTRVEGRRLFSIAEQVASLPVVRQELAPPEVVNAMPSLVQATMTRYGLDVVSVAGSAGTVKVSSDPTLEQLAMTYGSPAVSAGASWTGLMDVAGDRMLVSQTPVLYAPTPDSAAELPVGTRLGTVSVALHLPSVAERLGNASSYLLTYLGLALAIGGIGSWWVARRIKRQTLGLEPREIAGLAESREAMLFGLAEGVVALDTSHRITLVNNVARRLLDLPEHAVGMSIHDLELGPRLRDVLSGTGGERQEGEAGTEPGGIPELRDEVVIRRGRVLVMNRMEVTKDGRSLGSVTTLRDRTELASLERELGSFRSTTELLRAQTHEFANQLHTISGLIQIGEYDEVVRYVDSLSEHRARLDLTVTRRVQDNAIAALLMAKAAQAQERRVELRISDDTALDRLPAGDAADVATVVGNLLDNAFDAVANSNDEERWVEVAIRQDANSVEVEVTDSGPGLAPELATEVFTHGFTTKAAQAGERGIGLALTRLVCRRRGGEVEVASSPSGARFVARLTVNATEERPVEASATKEVR